MVDASKRYLTEKNIYQIIILRFWKDPQVSGKVVKVIVEVNS